MEEAMKKELEKTYNPQDIEQRLYDKWQEKKYLYGTPTLPHRL